MLPIQGARAADTIVWKKRSGISCSAELVYPEAFVEYLGRILLTLDPAVRLFAAFDGARGVLSKYEIAPCARCGTRQVSSWWGRQPEAGKTDPRGATFRGYLAALSDGLEQDYAGAGSSCDARSARSRREVLLSLCLSLAERFGSFGGEVGTASASERGAPPAVQGGANAQLAVLFALLPAEGRPDALIDRLLLAQPRTPGSGRVAPSEVTEGAPPPTHETKALHQLPTSPQIDCCQALPSVMLKNIKKYKSATAHQFLHHCDQVQEWWRDPKGLYPLPKGLRAPARSSVDAAACDVESALRRGSAAGLLGVTARATASAGAAAPPAAASAAAVGPVGALSREAPLTGSVYAAFAAAGALGCGGVHAAVVPLDVVKTRKQVTDIQLYKSNDSVCSIKSYKKKTKKYTDEILAD